MSDTSQSGVRRISGSGVSDTEISDVAKKIVNEAVDTSATSGGVSRASGDTNAVVAPTTTISTIAVQSGDTRIVLALLQSGEWLELRVVELSPGLVYLGSTLEEASALQKAHLEVLTKLQSQQSPVEDLLNQADQLISTQRPRAEVYAAMAESLGLAWRDLNSHLETRKNLLDLSVTFHTRARQYSDAMDAAEKVYTDNVMPTDVEAAKRLLTTLHDHKRGILESSMYTLQEAHVLLGRLKGLLHEGGSMDSRPQHIRTNIEFACSQIEHYLESLHDRRRFLDGLYSARKHHLEQCLALCVLYQDLTEAILNLKKLRDDISDHQDLGTSQANAEILLHEHLRRENAAKAQQDQCVRHVRTAEQMVASGHYAGAEARARAYSVLEAATALHETCDTRTALLEQAALFFKLATGALTKLDQAEVQVAGLSTQGGNQRLSVVMGVVEEAVQPALTEGYALLEVTGGRGQPHNQGVTEMVEQLENRRTRLSSLCAESTEKVLQKTELINSFLEMYNAIESWLIKIGDSFLRGHQDPGGSLSLAKDFLHLHLTLKNDLLDKSQEIDTVSAFLDQLSKELPDEELIGYRDKVENIRKHWSSLNGILESRIKLSENYVKFHEDAEKINSNFEDLELLLKNAKTESDNQPIEEKWQKIQQMYQDLLISGKQFIKLAKESDYPYLDINRAILCVEYILENLGKRKLVVTDLFTHYKQKISVYKELISLWNTYKENLKKMEIEMQNLEESLCPLLRGDPSKPENLADNLESRLSVYVKAVRSVQEDIQNMVTKAEVLAHNDEAGAERPEIVRSFLQLYQNLQNKATDYQILGTMLIQWCKNISEVHRSCDKMERQFGGIPPDASGVEKQLRELDASKHAVSELLKFAQHEADAIIQKIRVQCPYESGGKDIAKMKEMLERRRKVMEENWTERQIILERLLKKSHYQTDLKVIRDQLRDLNDQLNRMKGHYGDSLNAALNMRTAFNHFKQSVDVLGRRINNFVSTAEKILFDDEDSKSIQIELNDLQNKWSTFQMQVGASQKNIELSIEFFKLIDEAESWFKEGSQLLITVAGESSQIQTPEHANKLQQKIESFLNPGEVDQSNRITKISSLAFQLYGDTTPQQVEAVSQQNTFMLESFNVINKNLETLMRNLKTAEEQRRNQEKEQQELAASLAQAQVEAESARLAALAAEEARKVAEETVTAMAMRKITTSETVEVVVQTDPEPEPQIVHEELPPIKKVKVVEDEEEEIFSETLIPPMFLTPLVGATVTEGVKFTFECRVTGTPIPEVEWLKDGLSIMSNPDYRTYFDGNVCALTIEETFVEDSAFFTCRAQNKCGTAESSATLIVKESVPTEVLMPPSFSKRLSDFTVQEGSSFQLEANVTGHPLPVVSWSKNSICIDHSPDYIITYNNGECILRFEEVFMEDEAEYTCRATNDLGEDVTRAKLSVTATVASEKPSFPVPLSNLMARAGQKFKLECEVKGTPTPSLAWFHNNKQVKETPDCKISFDGKIASLIISEAFPKNAGKYTLVAKNTAGEAKTFSSVSVKGRIPTETSDSEITSDIDAEPIKPSVQQSLKDVLAKEGDTIRLDCIIIGQPEPEVIWYHDDKPVKESEDIRLLFHGDRCSLVIEEAFIEDIGEYKVVAMNSAGEASTSCNVSVEVPEKVPVPPPAEISVIALPPPAEPPRFSHLLVDTHVMEGEPVVLKASVSGSPNPTIAWFRDGVPVLPDDTLQIYEEPDGFVKIYIPRTNLDHTGQYEVIASNCAGTAKCIGFLSIEQRLPTPEPKEPPGFTKLLEDVTVESGNSISLEAEVTGKPKPLVYWTLNNSPIDEFEYLHGVKQYKFEETSPGKYCFKISTVSRAQDGRVAIVAENDVGKAVSACNLNVYDPPILVSTTPPPPPSTETFEKRTIISETHVTKVVSSSSTDVGTPQQQSYEASTSSHISRVSGQPTVEVHGSRVQEVKQEGPSEPKVSEKVNIIKVEDGHVVEELSTDSSKVPFEPAAKKLVPKRKSNPARFLTPLQGIILKENERAFFECVIDGYPEPSIKWTHNGNPVSGDALTSVDGNRVSLVIPQVGQHHSGRYTCSIDNEAGSAQCTCDLVVRKIQFPPVFSKRLQPSVIGVGERLHLEVDVSGTPVPEVSWSKNGQPLQSTENLIIKTEGSRSWLVIPEAKESDSGRYGVVASNGAGRAECLADVMVTSLSITEPKSIITFTDISDDSRNQIGFVGAERVKTFTKLIETTSKETCSPIIPVSFTKIDKDITDQVPLATPATLQPSPEPSVEKEEKKLPGKLRLSWPPQEPEEDIRQKLDVEISTNKVSNIISSFNTISESEIVLGEEQPLLFEKVDAKVWNPSITPEPEPQYGYIEVTPSIDHLIPPDQEAEQEKSITPEFNIPSSSEFETFDGDFSDNILSTPATSDYYPKTSPSVEVELAERFHQISEEPEISQAISEIPEETETKEDMEVRTEKHSRESSYTEIKKSVSSTEKTIVETRVYREYDDETEVPEIKKSSPILQREEIVEYIAPKTTEVIEHKAVPVIDQNGAAETLPSQDFEVKTPISHSYTASEKSSSFSSREAHSSYISSSQVETKVYPQRDQHIEIKAVSDEFTSGDEFSRSPIPPDGVSNEKRMKKKRESVKQIALRLEETIIPMSPEEVPGGIRMFPPKPSTPSIEPPTTKDLKIDESEDIEDKVKISFSEFPKLEPFPFSVEERPKVEKPKGPPPPMPKKFIPGTFTDSECESDLDIPIGEKFVPKKIKFEAKSTSRVRSSSESEPPPPSSFDKPPVIEGMRPEILKMEEIQPEPKIKKPLVDLPKKKPKIVQKFLTKAADQQLEMTKPKPSSQSVTKVENKELIHETKIFEEKIVKESETTKPVSKKLEKIWPPPEPIIVSPAIEDLKMLKSIGTEEEKPEKQIVPEQPIKIISASPTQQISETLQKDKVIVAPIKSYESSFKAEAVTPATVLQEIPSEINQSMTFTSQSSFLQTTASGFKSVKAPSPVPKKEKPFVVSSPAPPFDISPTVITPVVTSESTMKTSQIKDSYQKKELVKESHVKSFVSAKKETKLWPPVQTEVKLGEIRSHSLERPPVTVAPSLPLTAHEAPPAIYWSSSITLKEKRHSLPLEYMDTSSTVLQQESISQQQYKSLQRSTDIKRVKIQEPLVKPQEKTKTNILQRKPTPASIKPISNIVRAAESKETKEQFSFEFKPMPKLEPFPFVVEEKKERVRQYAPPPPKPTKFIPGSFTESDYESDYEGKPPSIWRPYMSDTETSSFKPVRVKLKQGRHRRPKVPSPPAPTEFDIPPRDVGPLRPSVSLSDLEGEETFIEKKPLQMTPIKCKFTKKTSKPKTPAIIKPIPIRPTQPIHIISPPAPAVNGPIGISQTRPVISAPTPASTLPFSHSQEKAVHIKSSTIQQTGKIQSGVTNLKDQYQIRPGTLEKKFDLGKPQLKTSAFSSQSSLETSATSSKRVNFINQSGSGVQKISTSTPNLSSREKIVIPVKREPVPLKPSSPKLVKKTSSQAIGFEESGYTADTESTLPRKLAKSQAFSQTSNVTSFSKSESHSASFSSKSESKNYHSKQFGDGDGFTSFPGGENAFNYTFSASGGGIGGGFPPSSGGIGGGFPPRGGGIEGGFSSASGGIGGGFPPGGGPSGPSGFPSQTFPTFNQSGTSSSFFSSSESKSSQYYSTTKTEEIYEKRSGTSEDIHRDSRPPQQEERKPKFEEFRRETKGKPGSFGPFSEDTYYSMSDESETVTGKDKKKTKVEMKKESHVQTMSDKKSEYYSYSSSDNAEKPKKDSPKSMKKKMTKFDIPEGKESGIKIEIVRQLPVKHIKTETLESQEKSGIDKKIEMKPFPEKKIEIMKSFPFKTATQEEKKPKVPTSPKSTRFIKIETEESDIKVPPLWKTSDSDKTEPSYTKVFSPKLDRKSQRIKSPSPPSKYEPYPKFEDAPRPVIEFPDSEPELTPRYIKDGREPPQIIPKEDIEVKAKAPPQKYEPRRSPSPVLIQEPPPEEGFIPPPKPFSNAFGVESKKVTKIEDSSQFHKRFVTMEQTTRLIKLTDAGEATPTYMSKFQSKPQKQKTEEIPKYKIKEITLKEIPKFDEKPLPKLEPFPFSVPTSSTIKIERGPPPPVPKRFIKGEMRESDYESDSDIHIKPVWNPPDSDAEDISYGKVEAPVFVSKVAKISKERTPTPPSIFDDKPPPTGEPMRPSIEPVEVIKLREVSPEYIIPTEISLVEEKELAKVLATRRPSPPMPPRQVSPPLPPPGSPPVEGIIIPEVTDGIMLSTEHPEIKPSKPKKKPYREIVERTERQISDKHYTEERTFRTGKVEIVKTTVREFQPEEARPTIDGDLQFIVQERKLDNGLKYESKDLKEVSQLELFPFRVEETKPKKQKLPPPPQPRKFEKVEMSESGLDSDLDEKIPVLWKPPDSDVEEPSYSKIEVSLPKGKRAQIIDQKYPTPPSVFDKGPAESELLKISQTEVIPDTQTVKITPIQKMSVETQRTETKLEHKFQKLGSEKVFYKEIPKPAQKPTQAYGEFKEKVDVKSTPKKRYDIDIDIVDIYDYASESETERIHSEIGAYKTVPDLEPFPYTPDPQRPKRERGPPPPMPKKFMKGEFKESDYESEYEGKIPPKWGPTDSESEGLSYRKVKPPETAALVKKPKENGKLPHPPSSFDFPPAFEGPPRPIVDLHDIPRRERRESLEEYSIPKFPKVEFRPFELDDETVKKTFVQTTDTETTDTEAVKDSLQKSLLTKQYAESAQQYVGEKLGDMSQTFRSKAHLFAEQLVSEVFAGKDGTTPTFQTEPEAIEQIHIVEKPKERIENGLDVRQPQSYRDESRISEFGSKHIDPDSGLIYFKYDFGYEFGIVLPGEARKIARSRSVPPGDKSGDIEIPVIHERSDDESKSSKKVKFSSSKGDKGKVLQYSVPKKQSQFQCLPKEPFSDSEAETRIRAHLPHAKPKFVAPYVKPFAPPLPKSSLKRNQPFQKTDRGPDAPLSSPSLVSMATSPASSTHGAKPPAFISTLKDYISPEGEELRLECVVKSALPTKISWYKNGFLLREGHRCQTQFKNGVCRLILLYPNPDDSGYYTCYAESALGKDSTSTSVVVSPGEAS